MQSKNEPGDSERALAIEAPAIDPIEPTFLLRGSDPVSYLLMLVWGIVHERLGTISQNQALGAYMTASAMEQWARGQGLDVDRALLVWAQTLGAAAVRLQGAGIEQIPAGQRLQ